MRRYSTLQAIPLSFFSRELYRDVARSWRGIGIVFLLIVVAILVFLLFVRLQLSLNRWAQGPAQAIVEQVPTIVIRHRVVEVDRPMPYVIQNPKTGEEIVVVDTTGQITSVDGLEARALLTADQFHYRRSSAETRVFHLSGVKDLTITSAKARRWLTLLSIWMLPILIPFIFGGLFVFRLFQVLVFALIGLLVARLLKVPLDLAALMRLTAVALTPALILEPVIDLVGWKPPAWELIWCVIALAYLVWGVLANRPQANVSATALDPSQASPGPPPV